MSTRILLFALLSLSPLACGSRQKETPPPTSSDKPSWQPQVSNTDAGFSGLCAVTADVAWVSGTKGTFGRTTDGGRTWSIGTVAGAEDLDFRDVEAFSEYTAYLLAAGPGDKSRIYKTTDAGKSWTLQFKNADPAGFYDALAFWDEKNGIAFGDPIKERFQLLTTTDGGENWRLLPTQDLPQALPNESAFAASGTCLITRGSQDAWFVTGGGKMARVFHSADRGKTWTAHETPIAAGTDSSGIFSIAFRDRDHGMIVGGDYKKMHEKEATAALTADGGKTWTLTKQTLPFRSAVAWAKDRWIVVGTSGSDSSRDDGATWDELNRLSYNSVAFVATGEGWAVGEIGRIARFGK